MKTVGLRELKNKLSEYVRQVRAGEEFLVCDRGQVVAELGPPRREAQDPRVPPGLAAMAKRGAVTLGEPNDPAAYPVLSPLVPEGTAGRLIDEERDES